LKIDLSQFEMYIVAILTGCERLIELLAQGKDIYVEVAAEIFGKEPSRGSGPGQVSNELRSVTKTLVLGISYCLGIRSFIKQVRDRTGIIYERQEAQGFYDTFFELFPGIRATHEQSADDSLHLDSVFTVTGQRRFLPPLRNDQDPISGYWPSLERRKRILVNTPIQGSAANLFIRAVNKFMPLLAEGVEAINLVHDEVDLLVTEGTLSPTIQVVTQSFKEAFGELYGDRLEVKLEHSSGRSWGGSQ
jgi:DNA polymerase I